MSELKACQCGNDPFMWKGWMGFKIECERCNIVCPGRHDMGFTSEDEAIKRWNTRPIEDNLRAELDRAKKDIWQGQNLAELDEAKKDIWQGQILLEQMAVELAEANGMLDEVERARQVWWEASRNDEIFNMDLLDILVKRKGGE